jgi:glycosyltransferase involved in cell wall biosynthesis
MPVFNGEPYLREAIDSIQAQTYGDFELIISDNASTDATRDICEEYASRDSRIRYYRNIENLGGGWNQNRVVQLSHGEYFTWAHHDDVREPEFIEKALKVLDSDPSIVLCYSLTSVINEEGMQLNMNESMPNLMSDRPCERFLLACMEEHRCEAMFGLIRLDILKRTRGMRTLAVADRVLTAELCLYGKIFRMPEKLFFRRVHPSQASFQDRYARTIWWDPKKLGKIVFPHFREFIEYILVIKRVSIQMDERFRCFLGILVWPLINRRGLYEDIFEALRNLLRPPEVLRPIWRPVLTWIQRSLKSFRS